MTRAYTAPDFRAMIADLRRRVDILERRTRATATTDSAWELVFSYAGSLTVSESPPALIPRSAILNVLAVAFKTGSAGSTSTVLAVKKNATTVATVTVPASTETYNADISVSFDADDRLSIAITTVGTGAADMTAEARFT